MHGPDPRPDHHARDAVRPRDGRMAEACGIGDRACPAETAPRSAPCSELSIAERAISSRRAASQAGAGRAPGRPAVAANLGAALAQLGDYGAHGRLVPETLAASDPTMGLYRMRGFGAQECRRFRDRRRMLPKDHRRGTRSTGRLEQSRQCPPRAGRCEGAVRSARRSVGPQPQAARSRLNYATALAGGRFDEAERELRHGGGLSDDEKPLRELFALLKLRIATRTLLRDRGTQLAARRGSRIPSSASRATTSPSITMRHRRQGYRARSTSTRRNVLGFLGVATVFDDQPHG